MSNFVKLQTINYNYTYDTFKVDDLFSLFDVATINIDSIESVSRLKTLRMCRVVPYHTHRTTFLGKRTTTTERRRVADPRSYATVYLVKMASGDKFETTTNLEGMMK